MAITLESKQTADLAIAINSVLRWHRMISTGKFEGFDPKDVFHEFNANATIVNNTLQLPAVELYQDIDGNEY